MATKKKSCKDCAKKEDNYGPLVIVAPQWVLGNPAFLEFVQETRHEGGYVDVLITGIPPCVPTPGHPCPKK